MRTFCSKGIKTLFSYIPKKKLGLRKKEIDNISYAIVASPCCTFLGQVTVTSVLRLMALILLWRSKHVRRRHKTRNSTTETNVNTMECREKFSGLGEAAGTAVRSREGNI